MASFLEISVSKRMPVISFNHHARDRHAPDLTEPPDIFFLGVFQLPVPTDISITPPLTWHRKRNGKQFSQRLKRHIAKFFCHSTQSSEALSQSRYSVMLSHVLSAVAGHVSESAPYTAPRTAAALRAVGTIQK